MDARELEERHAELAAIRREINADRDRRILRSGEYRAQRDARRLALEREISAALGEPYADPMPLDVTIGDEWYVLTGSCRDTVLLSGDAGAPRSSLLRFAHAAEARYREDDVDDEETSHLTGHGLDVYGLFVVRNSVWKRQYLERRAFLLVHDDTAWWNGFEHFLVCGKGGRLSCLARSCASETLDDSIVELRKAAAAWWRTGR